MTTKQQATGGRQWMRSFLAAGLLLLACQWKGENGGRKMEKG